MPESTGGLPAIGVRVVPDSAGFDDALRTKLKRTEKRVKARIKVVPELDRAALLKIRERLQSLGGRASVATSLDRASYQAAKAKLDSLDGTATVKVDLDRSALSALRKALRGAKFSPDAPATAGDPTGDKARSRRKEQLKDLAFAKAQTSKLLDLREQIARTDLIDDGQRRSLMRSVDALSKTAGGFGKDDLAGKAKFKADVADLTKDFAELRKPVKTRVSTEGTEDAKRDLAFLQRNMQALADMQVKLRTNSAVSDRDRDIARSIYTELSDALESGFNRGDYKLKAEFAHRMRELQEIANQRAPKVAVGLEGLPAVNRALLKATENLDAELELSPELNQKRVAKAREQLEALGGTLKVDADLSAIDVARIRQKISSIKAYATVRPRLSRAWAGIGKTLGAFTTPITKSQALRSSLPFDAMARSARAATVQMAKLTATASGAFAVATLAAGALATIGPALGSVVAVGLNALGGTAAILESIAGGLKLAAGASLALPGILAGGVAGFAVMAASVRYSVQRIEGLGTALSRLRENIAQSSWEAGGNRLQTAFDQLWPIIEEGTTRLARAAGGIIGEIADAMMSGAGVSALDSVITNTERAMEILRDVTQGFTESLLRLVDVGAQYLPRLAGWAAELAERFSEWIDSSTASGEIFNWIDTGIEQLHLMWLSLVATKDIIKGLFDAMSAGYDTSGGFGSLLGGLRDVSAFVNGGEFQSAIGGLFIAAREASGQLKGGVDALWDAFVKLEDTHRRVLNLSGQGFGDLLEGVAAGFSSDSYAERLESMFAGFASGMSGFAPALAPIIDVLAAAGDAVGKIAAAMGPRMAQVVEQAAPLLIDMFDRLGAAAPGLADGIGGFFEAVIRGFEGFAAANPGTDVLGDLMQSIAEALPVFGEALGAVLPHLPGLLAAIIPMVGALARAFSEVVPVLLPIIEGVAQWISQNPELALGLVALLAAIGPLITLIAAIAGVINAIAVLWPVLAPVLAALVGALLGPAGIVVAVGLAIAAVGAAFWFFRDEIAAALQAAVDVIAGWVDAAIGGFQAFSSGARDVLADGLAWVMGMFESWGDGLRGFFEGLFTGLMEMVAGFVDTLTKIPDKVGQIANGIGGTLGDLTGLDGSGLGASWSDIRGRFDPGSPNVADVSGGGRGGRGGDTNVTIVHPTGTPTDESVREAAELLRF